MAADSVNKSQVIRDLLDSRVNQGEDISSNIDLVNTLKEEYPNEDWTPALVAQIKAKRGGAGTGGKKRGRPKAASSSEVNEAHNAPKTTRAASRPAGQRVEVSGFGLADMQALKAMAAKLGGPQALKQVVDELVDFGA